jgi:hypothetical protein
LSSFGCQRGGSGVSYLMVPARRIQMLSLIVR